MLLYLNTVVACKTVEFWKVCDSDMTISEFNLVEPRDRFLCVENDQTKDKFMSRLQHWFVKHSRLLGPLICVLWHQQKLKAGFMCVCVRELKSSWCSKHSRKEEMSWKQKILLETEEWSRSSEWRTVHIYLHSLNTYFKHEWKPNKEWTLIQKTVKCCLFRKSLSVTLLETWL